VNASHRLVSPLYPDGTFELVTIPDPASPVSYGDVPRLRGVVPERFWGMGTHYDPEFETKTYGDNCGRAPRAAALKACRPGDYLFFIARLVAESGPVFALVGFLRVEAVLARACGPAPERFAANAHELRARAQSCWDGFWVFAGGPESRLFQRAVIVGRGQAELLLRDRAGGPWSWRPDRSDLQTIGSYTRSCRCIIDPVREPARAQAFWRWLEGSGQVAAQVPLRQQEQPLAYSAG